MAFVGLLVSLVAATRKAYLFELSPAMQKNIKDLVAAQDGVALYGLSKFLSYCKDATELKSIVSTKAKELKQAKPKLDLSEVIQTSQILSRYSDLEIRKVNETVELTLDIDNHGFIEAIPSSVTLVASDYANGVTIRDVLSASDATNLLAISLALKQNLVKADISACGDLAAKLVQNLAKNNRQLRIATLRLMDHAFEPLNFVEYDPE